MSGGLTPSGIQFPQRESPLVRSVDARQQEEGRPTRLEIDVPLETISQVEGRRAVHC